MKRFFLFIGFGLVFFLYFSLNINASTPSFNISSKEKMLGSVFDNLVKVNENFTNIEDPFYNPELYKYGLIINDILEGNAESDNTTLKERFYFDYDDYNGGKNYTKRGNSLFNAITLASYLSCDLDSLNERIQNPVVLEYLYE